MFLYNTDITLGDVVLAADFRFALLLADAFAFFRGLSTESSSLSSSSELLSSSLSLVFRFFDVDGPLFFDVLAPSLDLRFNFFSI